MLVEQYWPEPPKSEIPLGIETVGNTFRRFPMQRIHHGHSLELEILEYLQVVDELSILEDYGELEGDLKFIDSVRDELSKNHPHHTVPFSRYGYPWVTIWDDLFWETLDEN